MSPEELVAALNSHDWGLIQWALDPEPPPPPYVHRLTFITAAGTAGAVVLAPIDQAGLELVEATHQKALAIIYPQREVDLQANHGPEHERGL